MDICRGRREFVLNYVIGDEEVWGRVERVRVEDRTESDHFSLVVWIRGEGKVSRRVGGGRRRSWRWTEEDKRFLGRE